MSASCPGIPADGSSGDGGEEVTSAAVEAVGIAKVNTAPDDTFEIVVDPGCENSLSCPGTNVGVRVLLAPTAEDEGDEANALPAPVVDGDKGDEADALPAAHAELRAASGTRSS